MCNKRNLKKNDVSDKETNQQLQITGHADVKTKWKTNKEQFKENRLHLPAKLTGRSISIN